MQNLILSNDEIRTLFHGLEFTLKDMNDKTKKDAFIEIHGVEDFNKAKQKVVDLQNKLLNYV